MADEIVRYDNQKIIDVEFTYKVVAGRNYNLTCDIYKCGKRMQ